MPLSYEQFRYSFVNAVGEDEAKERYLGYSVPGAGEPLFQAASEALLVLGTDPLAHVSGEAQTASQNAAVSCLSEQDRRLRRRGRTWEVTVWRS